MSMIYKNNTKTICRILSIMFILSTTCLLMSCESNNNKQRVITGNKLFDIYNKHAHEYKELEILMNSTPNMDNIQTLEDSQRKLREVKLHSMKLNNMTSRINKGFSMDIQNALDINEKKIFLKEINKLPDFSKKEIKSVEEFNYLYQTYLKEIIINLTGKTTAELFPSE